MSLRIDIVDPRIDRGRTPRDIQLRDIISVPVTYQRGTSITALWKVHSTLTRKG